MYGYLEKKKHKSLFGSGYQKRFFKLVNYRLMYYAKETDLAAKGVFDMRQTIGITANSAVDGVCVVVVCVCVCVCV